MNRLMKIFDRGYCPFRVAKPNFQPGCVLQMKKESLCYTRDNRPLMLRKTEKEQKEYYCPLVNFTLSNDTYTEINGIVESILVVQDEQETCINLWPVFCQKSKITNPKEKPVTIKGKEIQQLSKKVRDLLQEIVLNLM